MREPCWTQTLPVTNIDHSANCNVSDAVDHTHAPSKQNSLCDIVTPVSLPVKQIEERKTNREKHHEINESKAVRDIPCTAYLSKVDLQSALESSESKARDADLPSVHEQLQKLLYEEDDWRYDFDCPSSEVKSLAAGTDVSAGQHMPGNLTEDNQLVTELATLREGHTDFNSLLKTDEAYGSGTSMGKSSPTLPVESDSMCLCSAFGHEKEKPSVHLLNSNHVSGQIYLENKHCETQPDHNRSIQMSTSQKGITMTDNGWQSCGAESSLTVPEAPSSPLALGQEILSDVPANYLGQFSYTEQDVHCTDGPIAKRTYTLPTKEANVTLCHSGIKECANLAEFSLKENSSSNLSDKSADQFTREEHSSVTAVSKCTKDTFQEKGTKSEMKAQNDNNGSIYHFLTGNHKDFRGISDAQNCGCYMQEHSFIRDTASKIDKNGLEDTGQDPKRIQESIGEPVFTASYKVRLFTDFLLEINKNGGIGLRQVRKVVGATAEPTDPVPKHELEMPLLDSQQREKKSSQPGEIVRGLGMDSVGITAESGKPAALNTIQDSDIRNKWNTTGQKCQNTSNMAGNIISKDKDCSTNSLVTGYSSIGSLMQTEPMLNAIEGMKDAQTCELSQDQYQRVEEKIKTQTVPYEREKEMIMLLDLETTEVEPCMWSPTDSEEQINSCDSTKLQQRYQKVREESQTKIIPCERDAEETEKSMICHLEEAEVEPYVGALINSEELYSWHDSTDYVHPSMILSNEQTSVGGNVVTSTGHRSARAAGGSQNLGSSEHAMGTLVSISPCASKNSHQSQEQLPQGKTQPCTVAATAEDPYALKEERAKLQEASKLCKSPSAHSGLEDMKPKQVPPPKLLKNIQAELFPDFSGNIKLCCQFGEIHEDSIITWTKDSKLLARVQRSAGDDFPVSLAIVQAGKKDQGLYYCSLKNACGKATAEFQLTSEVLEHLSSFQDVEGLEEIEFLQLMFREDFISDSYFSNSLHGRITTEELHFGEGVHRKAFRSKVMQGLVPVFSPGHPCVLKVHNAIAYGTKNNDELVKKNYKLALQECYVQNTAREYAKAYAAETKILEGFGEVPEIIPIFLIHRPKNNIPYATVEEELIGEFVKYSVRDGKEINFMRRDSEAGQKCCTFQHWVFERTSGSLLITDMQGVGMKLTDVGIATLAKGAPGKVSLEFSKLNFVNQVVNQLHSIRLNRKKNGKRSVPDKKDAKKEDKYKGFKGNCSTSFIDQFKALHQCNKYCEMLGLKSFQTNCQKQRKPAATKTKAQPSLSTVKKTVINAQTAKKK
ncbi:hypothetical protein lerEdw1_004162 [Lerista edwardsae]|nr:hypothetical protein lerEdw1_004162 [Lerista edwardsae]